MIDEITRELSFITNPIKNREFWHNELIGVYDNEHTRSVCLRNLADISSSLMRRLLYLGRKNKLINEGQIVNLDSWDEDANPIFHAYIPKINKSVRIIQLKPEDRKLQLSVWTEESFFTFAQLKHSSKKTYELVIATELSNETYESVMLIMFFWMSQKHGILETQWLIRTVFHLRIRGKVSRSWQG